MVEPTNRIGDMPPPDPEGLRQLTRLGDGFYGEALAPLALTDGIAERAAAVLADGEDAVLFFRDFGRYLLVLALFPALALFRRSL